MPPSLRVTRSAALCPHANRVERTFIVPLRTTTIKKKLEKNTMHDFFLLLKSLTLCIFTLLSLLIPEMMAHVQSIRGTMEEWNSIDFWASGLEKNIHSLS